MSRLSNTNSQSFGSSSAISMHLFLLLLIILSGDFVALTTQTSGSTGVNKNGNSKGGVGVEGAMDSSDYMFEHMTVLEEIHMLEKLVSFKVKHYEKKNIWPIFFRRNMKNSYLSQFD